MAEEQLKPQSSETAAEGAMAAEPTSVESPEGRESLPESSSASEGEETLSGDAGTSSESEETSPGDEGASSEDEEASSENEEISSSDEGNAASTTGRDAFADLVKAIVNGKGPATSSENIQLAEQLYKLTQEEKLVRVENKCLTSKIEGMAMALECLDLCQSIADRGLEVPQSLHEEEAGSSGSEDPEV